MGRLEPDSNGDDLDRDSPYVVYIHGDEPKDSWEVPTPYPTWDKAEVCCKALQEAGIESASLEIVPVAYAIKHYRRLMPDEH